MAGPAAFTVALGQDYTIAFGSGDGMDATDILNNNKIESGSLRGTAVVVSRRGVASTYQERASAGLDWEGECEFAVALADGYALHEQLGVNVYCTIANANVTPNSMFVGFVMITSVDFGPWTQDNYPTVRVTFVNHGAPVTVPLSTTKPS